MILYINTSSHEEIIIALRSSQKILSQRKIKAPKHQAEKLLPAISQLLESQGIKLQNLEKIIVANQGASFTALRIGVITANALAYALQIPIEAEPNNKEKKKKFGNHYLVQPHYNREPLIGASKKFQL